jgi:hypothetical protein
LIAYDIICSHYLDGVIGSQQAGGPLPDGCGILKEWL